MTVMPERQDNQVILLRGLNSPASHFTNRSCPCDTAHPEKIGAVTVLHLGEHYLLDILVRDHPNKKRLPRNQEGCNIRDKHLRQFIIAWYGIALSDGEVKYFFVFGIRVGVHLREDCHHLVDAPDNIAISIANKISALLKVDT